MIDSAVHFWCTSKASNESIDAMTQDSIISTLEGAIIKLAATAKWRTETFSEIHIQQ